MWQRARSGYRRGEVSRRAQVSRLYASARAVCSTRMRRSPVRGDALSITSGDSGCCGFWRQLCTATLDSDAATGPRQPASQAASQSVSRNTQLPSKELPGLELALGTACLGGRDESHFAVLAKVRRRLREQARTPNPKATRPARRGADWTQHSSAATSSEQARATSSRLASSRRRLAERTPARLHSATRHCLQARQARPGNEQ